MSSPETLPRPAPRQSLVRRLAPWVIGVAILAVIALRIPYAAFASAIGRGPHVTLAIVSLCVAVTTMFSDSIASWVGLIVLGMRRPFGRVCAVRGATFLLTLMNYALGQSGFGYYLNRTGTPPLRAVGAVLFLIGTNLATLLIIMPIMWLIDPAYPPAPALAWLVGIGCAGFAGYLIVIRIAPGFLTRRQILAPLFDAGWRGHALAMIGRLPHVGMIVIGMWSAMNAWGIAVPLRAALSVAPAVAVASSLPISVAGLGTSQAAVMYFFATYASGTAEDRAAYVLAFSIVHLVYSTLASIVIGVVLAPAARRASATTTRPSHVT